MTEAIENATPIADDVFDLGTLTYSDEIEYKVKHPVTGEDTTWVWRIAGPGHYRTIEADENHARRLRDLEEKRAKERTAAARANKLPPDHHETLAEQTGRAVDYLEARVLGFTPATINGARLEYSQETVKSILKDRRTRWLFNQLNMVLGSDARFLPSAEPTS